MSGYDFDLVIIGAGSGGLTAAEFAAQLGTKVALVEKHRIGGDCTWTGCVPSKALLKVAKVAHQVRTAGQYGIITSAPVIDMAAVRAFIRRAIDDVYQFESPEELERKGVEVISGHAHVHDAATILVNQHAIRSKTFLITTGARPRLPDVAGLNEVPYLTYEKIFDIDQLPATFVVIGGGPVGMELAQTCQRLGSQVFVIAERLLQKDEPEASLLLQRILELDGVRFVTARAHSVRKNGSGVVVAAKHEEVRGDALLIACGRVPTLAGLDLEKAGVKYSAAGIPVDEHLRTNVKHIYAAGDVIGGLQFTHLAGWQGFQAARNALLPGSAKGVTELVPWVTYTDPEVAHVGMTEQQAQHRLGSRIQVHRWEMNRTGRAVCEDSTLGFLKMVADEDGRLSGATVVHPRAGETVAELVLAINHRLKLSDLAAAVHPYPSYSSAVQQLAAQASVESLLSGTPGRIVRGLSKWAR
jgi:pyruvate/2-oxoglutarate dehydrogenase complex dihydrolipoamide dehydrogenase (E3) component